MTSTECQAALEVAPWTFAKTMPHMPHHYTLRDRWENKELFDTVALHLNSACVTEKFGKRSYCYFYAGEWKYWTMERPGENPILINRAKV